MKKPYLLPDWCGYAWSPWVPFQQKVGPPFSLHIKKGPGLYRIRVVESSDTHKAYQDTLMYIGISGRCVYERVRALIVNTLRETPPRNDPHTAAPCLWAYRVENSFRYEVSVATPLLDASKKQRKKLLQCMEDHLLYMYRVESKGNTLANHGHFHPLYQRPPNGVFMTKATIICDVVVPSAVCAEILPSTSFLACDWLNLSWSLWSDLHDREAVKKASDSPGIYRLREGDDIVYFGQAINICKRLSQHQKKYRDIEDMQFSYVHVQASLESLSVHLYEQESDIIGIFYAQTGICPRFQYG